MTNTDLILDEHGLEIEWTTKDGTAIPLSKLEDSHLHNIEKFISKTLASMHSCSGFFDGIDKDIADLEQEQSWIEAEILRRKSL